MKLISVNIAMPEMISIKKINVLTGINKTPQIGRIWLGKNNLTGDGQADLAVHGGEFQAAYCYPLEHYAYWKQVLDKAYLPYGTFGENFTTTGLNEENTYIGDMLAIGDSIVQVTMPRTPCFKFGHKVGKPDILNKFLYSGRCGFYLKVITEGMVGAEDQITLIERDPQSISIRSALGLQKLQEGNSQTLQHALAIKSLPPLLRDVFNERLSNGMSA